MTEQYCVKLDGQTVIADLSYEDAQRHAAEMNGENVAEYGAESIEESGDNLYEVSLYQPEFDLELHVD